MVSHTRDRSLLGFGGRVRLLAAAVVCALLLASSATAALAESFDSYVAGLWPEAHAHGVSRATFEAAFASVTPDPDVMAKTRTQAEFHKSLSEYLATAVSDKRIALGREKYREFGPWLVKAEARYGVDRSVILGVWGLETKFGTYMGECYVIRSLATLAASHYRGTYFRRELIKALSILQEGHIDPAHMMGSWAGAMGQTQFMPSNFKPYAVDFDGDGRRDIWTSVPDALGSTANFLKKHGWVAGEPWGYEASLPEGFEPRGGTGRYVDFATWAARGVRRADGAPLPRSGRAMLLQPTAGGPAFLVTPNFRIIKRYNNSTAYALGVGLLGERIAGSGALKTHWPVAAKPSGRDPS